MRRVRTIAVCLLAMLLAGSISVRAQEQPQRGGTLIFGVQAEPPNYDCHANTSFAFIHPVRPHYSTLLKFDPANYPAIVGDVAEGWEVSDDKLTYSFQLRPNVKFHDGSALTSKDIMASYEIGSAHV